MFIVRLCVDLLLVLCLILILLCLGGILFKLCFNDYLKLRSWKLPLISNWSPIYEFHIMKWNVHMDALHGVNAGQIVLRVFRFWESIRM